MTGIVRSGQTLDFEGHLLLLGDVNPGGTIRCTGDVYVLGALRGTVHAGAEGDEEAIIAASLMKPTQLRIADVISRPPDEWTSAEPWMEYAFLRAGTMAIDKMTGLSRQRKEVMQFKGV
jgi:septum site-determining protein MinC